MTRLFGLLAALGVATEATAQDRLRGIDVSHHQGDDDRAKVKGSGVAFAFALCGRCHGLG